MVKSQDWEGLFQLTVLTCDVMEISWDDSTSPAVRNDSIVEEDWNDSIVTCSSAACLDCKSRKYVSYHLLYVSVWMMICIRYNKKYDNLPNKAFMTRGSRLAWSRLSWVGALDMQLDINVHVHVAISFIISNKLFFLTFNLVL